LGGSWSGAHVLVADDGADLAHGGDRVEKRGYSVETAVDGEDALARASPARPTSSSPT
jgi:CheY-like chemotaxis protein